MADHEGNGLGSGPLRRHDQVAFVLTILVIDDDDHAPRLEVRNDLFHRIQAGTGPGGALAAQRNDIGHGIPRGNTGVTSIRLCGRRAT